MKNALFTITGHTCLLLIFLLTLLPGCKKEKDPAAPVISLSTGGVYTPNGSVTRTGGALHFGINSRPGDANITNLLIKKLMPNGSVKVVLDSGMNSAGFSVSETYYQSVEDTARWIFQIMDKNRVMVSTSLVLYKDPNSTWGGIFEYPLITMGYQDNTVTGQFLCCATGKVLQGDSAGLVSDLIDIATYYLVDDNLPSPTFSSPGEQGNGILEYYPFISSWSTKNYTKWDISVDANPIAASTYDACHNDSILIVSYNEGGGKRKFKWANVGDIIPFLTAKGKKGLIKVLTADEKSDGAITFSMKVQQ